MRVAAVLGIAATVAMPGLAVAESEPNQPVQQYTSADLGERIGANGTDSGGEILLPGQTITLIENVTRRPLFLAGTVQPDDIVIIDELSGREVPLTGKKVLHEGNVTRLLLPQLPAGAFSVTGPGGTGHVLVGDRVVAGMERTERTTGPFALAGMVGVLTALASGGVLLARRRRGSVLIGLSLGGLAACAVIVGSMLTAPAGTTPEQCADDTCRVGAFISIYDEGGPAALQAALQAFAGVQCHQVAHEVGYVLWRRDQDPKGAPARMVIGCDEGVPHGTVEALAAFSSDEDFPRLLSDVCQSAADQRVVGGCFHAGGHATIWRTNGDLAAAYKLCDQVSNPYGLYECHGSAVMEWADRWESAERAGQLELIAPNYEQPMQVCLEGPRDALFRAGCYLGTNHRRATPEQAAQWCQEKEPLVVACYSALGENLPYYSANAHPEQEKDPDNNPLRVQDALDHVENCQGAPSADAREICSRQVARIFAWINRTHTDLQDLCQNYPEGLSAYCTDEVDKALLQMEQDGTSTF